MPAKASEDTAAEFLPRFVAALREKGFVQNDIVERILSLKLGVTDRQIRVADKTYRKGRPAQALPASGASAASPSRPAASPQQPTLVAPSASTRVTGRTHAGLNSDEGLHRR